MQLQRPQAARPLLFWLFHIRAQPNKEYEMVEDLVGRRVGKCLINLLCAHDVRLCIKGMVIP